MHVYDTEHPLRRVQHVQSGNPPRIILVSDVSASSKSAADSQSAVPFVTLFWQITSMRSLEPGRRQIQA